MRDEIAVCWQPMDTCPKDPNMAIFVVLKTGEIIAAVWRKVNGDVGGVSLVDAFNYCPIMYACLWMPDILQATLPKNIGDYEMRIG